MNFVENLLMFITLNWTISNITGILLIIVLVVSGIYSCVYTIDDAGNRHITYVSWNGELKYCLVSNNTIIYDTVDTGVSMVSKIYVTIYTDWKGVPHIEYIKNGNKHHAYHNGLRWIICEARDHYYGK